MYSRCSYEKTRAAKLLFPGTRWLLKLKERAGEQAQGGKCAQRKLEDLRLDPSTCAKKPSKADGVGRSKRGGGSHMRMHTHTN